MQIKKDITQVFTDITDGESFEVSFRKTGDNEKGFETKIIIIWRDPCGEMITHTIMSKEMAFHIAAAIHENEDF